MLDGADFLFPRDLEATPLSLTNCLLVGSCTAETFKNVLKWKRKDVNFDYILFNNIEEMSDELPRPASEYDFQLIHLPIRSLIGDIIVRFTNYSDEISNQDIFDNSHNALRLMLDYALKYNKEHNILTFVQNFIVPQFMAVSGLINQSSKYDLRFLFQSLNATLASCIANYDNVYLIDADSIASSMGKRYFFDDMLVFFTHGAFWYPNWVKLERDRIEPVPPLNRISDNHLEQFCDAVWRACEYNYRVVNQIDSVKLVIFDLDDTLWRGMIGDHYESEEGKPPYEGWPLGVHEAIHHLKARGILVAVCSKNSPEIVKERWYRSVPLNWITLEDFVAVEIAWTPKVDGIARILSDVSLTPRSVVFVDDNPVERQAALDAFPGIRVIGSNPFTIRRILLNAPETQVRVLTEESVNRDAMIRRQKERETERKALSREEFLANLNCRITLSRIVDSADDRFARAFELLNKTNQFNTNGKRWTKLEIEDHFKNGAQIITFSVEDKFTSYGLVGVILTNQEAIEQFVMSCRVLGLDVELGVLRRIVRDMRGAGLRKPISASIVETSSNVPCRDVYTRAGFAALGDGAFICESDELGEIPRHLSLTQEN